MVARYIHDLFVPPSNLGLSKVSHRLRLSRREKIGLCLKLSFFFLACFAILSLFVTVISSLARFPVLSRDEYHGRGVTFGFNTLSTVDNTSLSSLWAYNSPYHPAGEYEGSIREGCVVTQVNILQRHGARYPSPGATEKIKKALKKLQAAETYSDHRLDFLTEYTYELGVDDLVRYGARQSYALGEETFKRYRNLITQSSHAPFVRASGSERVIFSAGNWTLAFSAASNQAYPAKVDLIIPETPGSNNTLGHEMCPAAVNPKREMKSFINTAAQPIAARLNSVAPGANLGPRDVYAIMHLCPFETVAKETLSPFCSMFSEEDFEIYEYAGDLWKFYGRGYGAPLGPVQGVGYINELIGRLTNSPAHHGLQTNKTLLSSPQTFPLDRAMYVDFSHGSLMISIFAAMGLFNQTNGPLDATQPNKDRTWVISKMMPFSGHMTVERLSCSALLPPLAASRSRPMKWWNWMMVDQEADYGSEAEVEEYVRIFVNDAKQPLEFCGADEDGMCKLDDFVNSQEYARNDGFGDFEGCGYTGT